MLLPFRTPRLLKQWQVGYDHGSCWMSEAKVLMLLVRLAFFSQALAILMTRRSHLMGGGMMVVCTCASGGGVVTFSAKKALERSSKSERGKSRFRICKVSHEVF